jgi:hypothetical protein
MPQALAKIRLPRFADGQWYSANASQLQTDIETYLAGAPRPALPGPLRGLFAPHAGHFFSGHVAAAAFAALSPGMFETVALIGPDHRGAASGAVAAPDAAAWRTPLGDIPVDWTLLDHLESHLPLTRLPADHEHSLEIELPFLQVALQKFKLAPLMMGSQAPAMCRQLAQALVAAIDRPERTLLVASSDLSHFFNDDTARGLDEKTLQFVLDLDAEGLLEHVRTGRRRDQPLACGAGPVAVVIQAAAALGANRATLLKYATSADVYPGKDSVVGYAAVAFTGPAI